MAAQNLTLRVGLDPAEAEHVVVRFLKDCFSGAGRQRAVVGLSGGVDSAVSATLGARALGPSNVSGIVLPSAATPAEDLEDAQAVADQLGISIRVVSIQETLDALTAADPGFTRESVGNAAARVRMLHLYEAARREQALVLGTGNKSELLTGYFTRWGDGGVDVQPLGDLYKTQVFALAEHLGLPERVRTKPPSARLWAGQTDEGDLGLPYRTLDRVLLGLEVRLPPDRIAQAVGLSLDEVHRVARIRERTQFKRRLPLAPKFGLRSPGIDWRDATGR